MGGGTTALQLQLRRDVARILKCLCGSFGILLCTRRFSFPSRIAKVGHGFHLLSWSLFLSWLENLGCLRKPQCRMMWPLCIINIPRAKQHDGDQRNDTDFTSESEYYIMSQASTREIVRTHANELVMCPKPIQPLYVTSTSPLQCSWRLHVSVSVLVWLEEL